MLRRYKLKLVTTSMECAHATADVPRTPTEAINEADAMAAVPPLAEACGESVPVDDGGAAPAIEVQNLPVCKSSSAADGHFARFDARCVCCSCLSCTVSMLRACRPRRSPRRRSWRRTPRCPRRLTWWPGAWLQPPLQPRQLPRRSPTTYREPPAAGHMRAFWALQMQGTCLSLATLWLASRLPGDLCSV